MDPDSYFCQSNLSLTLWTKFHILTQHKEKSHVHTEIRWFVSYYWPAHRKNDFLLKYWRILLTYLVCLLKVFSSNYNYSVGKPVKVRVRVQMSVYPICVLFYVGLLGSSTMTSHGIWLRTCGMHPLSIFEPTYRLCVTHCLLTFSKLQNENAYNWSHAKIQTQKQKLTITKLQYLIADHSSQGTPFSLGETYISV